MIDANWNDEAEDLEAEDRRAFFGDKTGNYIQ